MSAPAPPGAACHPRCRCYLAGFHYDGFVSMTAEGGQGEPWVRISIEDLACTLRLAFFSAVRRYRLVREAPAGKGYADLLMIPLRSAGDIPGVVVELKWDATPGEALAQVRERGYARAFRGTSAEGNVVLAGIAYDPRTKEHSCLIERL